MLTGRDTAPYRQQVFSTTRITHSCLWRRLHALQRMASDTLLPDPRFHALRRMASDILLPGPRLHALRRMACGIIDLC